MMTASTPSARLTSFSVIAPTPRSMIRSSTSSPTSILSSASSSASTEPDTSPLRMRLSVLDLALLEGLGEVLERDALARFLASCGVALARLPLLGDLAGGPVVGDDQELSPAPGTEVRPSTCTGRTAVASSTGLPCSSSMARTAVGVAGHDRVADPQRAALDEHGGDRAAAAVEVRLDGHALRRPGPGWPAGRGRRRR
jgi:hypothetical protein